MHLLFVDQSGKIEKSNVDTVIAVSNSEKITVRIPSRVKRELEDYARKRGRIKFSFYLKNFCIALAIALQEVVSRDSQIIIDVENPGHEDDIRFMLAERIKWKNSWFLPKQISFARVGKGNNAHKLANSVFRGRARANLELALREFIIRG